MSRAADTRRVLLPARAALPLLHQAIAAQGYQVEQQPEACQEQHAWLKRARDRQLALPICPPLVGAEWLARHRLEPISHQARLIEQLWLVLPQTAAEAPAARQCLRPLGSRLACAKRYADTA